MLTKLSTCQQSLLRLALLLPFIGLAAMLASCGREEAPTAEKAPTVDCGKVTVASMNWQSAEVIAQIDRIILKEGYGCDVEIVSGDTQPTLTSMVEKGEPDVAPEAWTNSMKLILEKATSEERLHFGAKVLKDGGVEGWWIPVYTAEKYPHIKSIADALEHPELFPAPENPDRGAVFNCPSGWNCQISTGNAFKAWGAEAKGFDLIDTGSAAGLDGSIAKAHERGENWLGYYWAPTSILGKYPMVKLDAAVPHDPDEWNRCNSKLDCENPVKNDWTVADVYTVITDRFKKSGGIAYTYLTTRNWSNTTVNELLAWMLDNQATGEEGAQYFLKNYPQVWKDWVPADVASRVKGSL